MCIWKQKNLLEKSCPMQHAMLALKKVNLAGEWYKNVCQYFPLFSLEIDADFHSLLGKSRSSVSIPFQAAAAAWQGCQPIFSLDSLPVTLPNRCLFSHAPSPFKNVPFALLCRYTQVSFFFQTAHNAACIFLAENSENPSSAPLGSNTPFHFVVEFFSLLLFSP